MRRRLAIMAVIAVGALAALAPSAGADHRGDLCIHTPPNDVRLNLVIGYCP
jgi:hypothetical protein